MKFIYVFAAIFVAVSAQNEPDYEHLDPYPIVTDSYPEWYVKWQQQEENKSRQRRDITLARNTNHGKIFGTLGSNDGALFGKAGYEHKFFDDHRGKLNGILYGSRIITPFGAATSATGGLNWRNNNTAASLDVSKAFGGRTTINAGAGGQWPLGKNGFIGAQGTYQQTLGLRPSYGVLGKIGFNF